MGGALRAYGEAIALDPDHTEAHFDLARLLYEQGDYQGAEEHWREAARCDPSDSVAHFYRGVALEKLGRIPGAISAYELALMITPSFPEAHYYLAQLYVQGGQWARATRHRRAYLRLTGQAWGG